MNEFIEKFPTLDPIFCDWGFVEDRAYSDWGRGRGGSLCIPVSKSEMKNGRPDPEVVVAGPSGDIESAIRQRFPAKPIHLKSLVRALRGALDAAERARHDPAPQVNAFTTVVEAFTFARRLDPTSAPTMPAVGQINAVQAIPLLESLLRWAIARATEISLGESAAPPPDASLAHNGTVSQPAHHPKPDPIAVAITLKAKNPRLTVRAAAEAVGMNHSTLFKNKMWQAACENLKAIGKGKLRAGAKVDGIVEAVDSESD